ncbi:hypothetical protein MHBO_000741 [Bonamia ostreae]|uniref:Uncharacterized protein n=1 Tax=Bonamia ostreae TaxID=126728 RepID=A0ABV2AGN5_9EUKA
MDNIQNLIRFVHKTEIYQSESLASDINQAAWLLLEKKMSPGKLLERRDELVEEVSRGFYSMWGKKTYKSSSDLFLNEITDMIRHYRSCHEISILLAKALELFVNKGAFENSVEVTFIFSKMHSVYYEHHFWFLRKFTHDLEALLGSKIVFDVTESSRHSILDLKLKLRIHNLSEDKIKRSLLELGITEEVDNENAFDKAAGDFFFPLSWFNNDQNLILRVMSSYDDDETRRRLNKAFTDEGSSCVVGRKDKTNHVYTFTVKDATAEVLNGLLSHSKMHFVVLDFRKYSLSDENEILSKLNSIKTLLLADDPDYRKILKKLLEELLQWSDLTVNIDDADKHDIKSVMKWVITTLLVLTKQLEPKHKFSFLSHHNKARDAIFDKKEKTSQDTHSIYLEQLKCTQEKEGLHHISQNKTYRRNSALVTNSSQTQDKMNHPFKSALELTELCIGNNVDSVLYEDLCMHIFVAVIWGDELHVYRKTIRDFEGKQVPNDATIYTISIFGMHHQYKDFDFQPFLCAKIGTDEIRVIALEKKSAGLFKKSIYVAKVAVRAEQNRFEQFLKRHYSTFLDKLENVYVEKIPPIPNIRKGKQSKKLQKYVKENSRPISFLKRASIALDWRTEIDYSMDSWFAQEFQRLRFVEGVQNEEMQQLFDSGDNKKIVELIVNRYGDATVKSEELLETRDLEKFLIEAMVTCVENGFKDHEAPFLKLFLLYRHHFPDACRKENTDKNTHTYESNAVAVQTFSVKLESKLKMCWVSFLNLFFWIAIFYWTSTIMAVGIQWQSLYCCLFGLSLIPASALLNQFLNQMGIKKKIKSMSYVMSYEDKCYLNKLGSVFANF